MPDTQPALNPEQQVAVVDQSGAVTSVRASQVPGAVGAGYRLATHEDLAQHQAEQQANSQAALMKQKEGGFGKTAAAFGEGVIRGAIPFSDVIAKNVAESMGGQVAKRQYEQHVEEQKALHPIASGAGELAGLINPFSAEGKLLSGAGKIAEHGIAGIIGKEATSLATRAVQKGAALGAQGAVENVLYGANQQINENSLGNRDTTVEKLIAGAKHNALIGFGVGGALGAGAEVAGPALRGLAQKAVGLPAGEGNEAVNIFERLRNNRLAKAIGGNRAAELAEDKLVGGVGQLGRDVSEELEKAGKSVTFSDPHKLSEFFNERREAVGKELGSMRESFDKMGAEAGILPAAESFANRVQEQVLGDLNRGVFGKKIASKIEKYVSEFSETAGESPTFKTWENLRKELDDKIYQGTRKASPSVDAWKQVRGIMEGEYEQAADAAAQQVGGAGLEEYKALKQKYASMRMATDMSEAQAVKHEAAPAFGLKDIGAGILGHAHLGGPGALLGALGHHLIAEKGAAIQADIFTKLAKLTEISRATEQVDSAITKGVKGFIKGTKEHGTRPTYISPGHEELAPRGKETSQDAFKRVATKITAMASNSDSLRSRIQSNVTGVAQVAPLTAGAMTDKAHGMTQYLAGKLPQGQVDPHSLTPQLEKPKYSQSDIQKFSRYLRATDNPMTLVKDLHDGRITPEAVEAVRDNYPKIYEQIKSQVYKELQETKEKPSYEKRIQIGILFQLPTDASLDPAFMRNVQATFPKPKPPATAGPQQAQRPSKTAQSKRPPAMIQQLQSDSEKIGQE